MAKHGGNTASCLVIGVHHSSSSPLHHLQLPDIFGSVWVPDDAGIFCERSDQAPGLCSKGPWCCVGIDGNSFAERLACCLPFWLPGQCDGSILGSCGYGPPDISLNPQHPGCDHVCYMDVWSISSCSWYSGLGISWGGIPWANLPPTSASCLSPPGAVWHPLHSWCPCTEHNHLQRVGPQSPPTLRLEGHWWKVKIATVQGHSPGARRTGLELYWKLRPPVILAVSAPQGSPLFSVRNKCLTFVKRVCIKSLFQFSVLSPVDKAESSKVLIFFHLIPKFISWHPCQKWAFHTNCFKRNKNKYTSIQLILKIIIFYYKLYVFWHRIASAFCHVKCIKHAWLCRKLH